MKKMYITGMAVLILSLAFVSCGGDDDEGGLPATSGKITITGLGEYVNKYIYATGQINNGATIFNAGGSNGSNVRITGDSINLKIWTFKSGTLSNFSESGSGGLAIYIFNSATDYPGSTPYALSSVLVNFTNGDGGSVEFTAIDLE
ncbi:MAG: hypothetical protein FWB95_08620 [Treponema sp.]|nr:hypothetical protein [Treponema sp.]